MVAQIRQVDLEKLFEQLENLRHEIFVESVEGHDRVLEHQVREVHESLVLVLDVEQHDGGDVAHALDVADVRPVHREGSQDPEQRIVILHAFLEEAQVREGSLDVLLNEGDGLFSLLDRVAWTVDLDQHEELLPDFVVLEIELFEYLGVVLGFILLALRCVGVQLGALLVAAGLRLALLEVLDLLLDVRGRAPVLNDFILNLLVLIEQLAQLPASLGHDVE